MTRSCFISWRMVHDDEGELVARPVCYYFLPPAAYGPFQSNFGLVAKHHPNARLAYGSPAPGHRNRWVCGGVQCCPPIQVADGGLKIGFGSAYPNYWDPCFQHYTPHVVHHSWWVQFSGVTDNFCTGCDVLNRPDDITHKWILHQTGVTCQWESDRFMMCGDECYIGLREIELDGPVWQLFISPLGAYWEFDGYNSGFQQIVADAPFAYDFCNGLPLTITISPITYEIVDRLFIADGGMRGAGDATEHSGGVSHYSMSTDGGSSIDGPATMSHLTHHHYSMSTAGGSYSNGTGTMVAHNVVTRSMTGGGGVYSA